MNRQMVKQVTLETKYPDGSTNKSTLDADFLGTDFLSTDFLNDVSSIIFDDACVRERENGVWNVSEDWRENPTMLIRRKTKTLIEHSY
jgi:hypothetical protein